jgi:DnaK suppressor protein
MNTRGTEEIRHRLTIALQEIEEAHEGSMELLADGFQAFADTVDVASQETDRKILLALRERDRQRAMDIRRALRQLEDGNYGICEECGEPIAPARLKAFPTTTLCVHCKEALEQEQYAHAK